jgi:isocitrate dehydrogenase kinase/phosphatase
MENDNNTQAQKKLINHLFKIFKQCTPQMKEAVPVTITDLIIKSAIKDVLTHSEIVDKDVWLLKVEEEDIQKVLQELCRDILVNAAGKAMWEEAKYNRLGVGVNKEGEIVYWKK